MVSHVSWASRNTQWKAFAHHFVQRSAISNAELLAFHAKQLWLERALSTRVHASPAPSILLYGSAVVGTAFRGGDVDFAAAFSSCTEQSGQGIRLHDPTSWIEAGGYTAYVRSEQPALLTQCFAAMANAYKADSLERLHFDGVKGINPSEEGGGGDGRRSVSLEQIYRARVPIVHCGLLQLDGSFATSSACWRKRLADGGTGDERRAFGAALLRWKELFPASARRSSDVTRATGAAAPSPSTFDTEFDVSVALTGCCNSLLLRQYVARSPLVRALAMVLKHWGRRGGPAAVLHAQSGWLSPYALTVMLVYYLAETNGLPAGLECMDPKSIPPLLRTLGKNPLSEVFFPEDTPTALVQQRRAALVALAAQGARGGGSSTAEGLGALLGGSVDEVVRRSPLFIEAAPTSVDEAAAAFDVAANGKGFAEVLRGFFEYYASFEFESNVIDIRPQSMRNVTRDAWDAAIRKEVAAVEQRWPGDLSSQELALGAPLKNELQRHAPLVERTLWHRLGHEALLIRDPIEAHSLGRGVDFFRAEALRERFRAIAMDASIDPERLL